MCRFVRTFFSSFLWLLMLLAGLSASPARAEIILGPDGNEMLNPADAQKTQLLGPEYKDDVHGFRIQILSGARIVQRNGTEPALQRLSFVLDTRQWGGTIETAFFKPATFSPEEYLKSSANELNKNFKAVRIQQSRTTTISNKPAARLTAFVETVVKQVQGKGKEPNEVAVGTLSLVKQELAVQVAGNEYLILTLYGPLSDKDDLIRAFDAMAETFQVRDRAEIEKLRLEAIKAGKEWFANRAADELTKRLVPGGQLFRAKVQGKDVGYVEFHEKEEEYLGFKGIGVYVLSQTFPAENLSIQSQSHVFWAYAQQPSKPGQVVQYSMWDNWVNNVTLQGNRATSAWSTENGNVQFEIPTADKKDPGASEVRGGRYIISVTRQQGNTANLLQDNPVGAPKEWAVSLDMPAPLPKVLEYLWPRVVDLSKPQRIAFVVFNSASNPGKLGLRTLSVQAPEDVTIEGQRIKATRLLDEIDPGSTTIWVDNNGKIVMMRTSDNALLVPTTEARMRQIWGMRLDRLKQLGAGQR